VTCLYCFWMNESVTALSTKPLLDILPTILHVFMSIVCSSFCMKIFLIASGQYFTHTPESKCGVIFSWDFTWIPIEVICVSLFLCLHLAAYVSLYVWLVVYMLFLPHQTEDNLFEDSFPRSYPRLGSRPGAHLGWCKIFRHSLSGSLCATYSLMAETNWYKGRDPWLKCHSDSPCCGNQNKNTQEWKTIGAEFSCGTIYKENHRGLIVEVPRTTLAFFILFLFFSILLFLIYNIALFF
jgi:hypothetical protein